MSRRYDATRVAEMMAEADVEMGVGTDASVDRAEALLDAATEMVQKAYGSYSVDHMRSICDHVEMQVAHGFLDEANQTIDDNDLDECVNGFVNGGELKDTPGAMDLVLQYANLMRLLGDNKSSRKLRAAAATASKRRN